MKKHLVLVGGGHAHLTTLRHADQFIAAGHRVTLIGPSEFHYYSGMGPGLLSGIYRPEEVRFHIRKMAEDRGAAFIRDRVVRIDPQQRRLELAGGDRVDYDAVSFNTGSFVPVDSPPDPGDRIFAVKPIENLLAARTAILRRLPSETLRLVVVGGGAAGLELAGNLRRLVRDGHGAAGITLVAGRRLLPGFPARIRQAARQALARLEITLLEGKRVAAIASRGLVLDDRHELAADHIFLAWGIRPSTLFEDSGLPVGENGGLLVNDFLQSVAYPQIFGGGDCISFRQRPLDKVGVYAVRQNPVLLHNLMAVLGGNALQPFDPGGDYLLIVNLGDGRGILRKKNFIWTGKFAFYLKDYIDRRFMKKFQVSGEQNPPANPSDRAPTDSP